MSKFHVDVEEIMKEIREEASRMEDLEIVDFDDISAPKNVWTMPKVNEKIYFHSDDFWYELENANKFVHISFAAPLVKENALAAMVRKIVVKLTRFYFKAIAERQNTYNANSARSLNEIGNFIRDMELMTNRQNEINEKFEMDIQEANLQFNKEYRKRLDAYERKNQYLKNELEKMKKQVEDLLSIKDLK